MNQFEMKQLAYQSQLKSRALQVLLYLIDRANKEQTCFPAVPTIGRELHISISTVKRAMRELVQAGYVKKESRFREGNRGQTSNLYTLFFTEDRAELQKESEETQQEEQPVNASEEQMEKEDQFENTDKCEREASAYTDVTGGGGQNDTTLNPQFNQRLKGEKEVFRKSKLLQFLGKARLFCLNQTVCHMCLFDAKKAGVHNGIVTVSEPNGINAVIPVLNLFVRPSILKTLNRANRISLPSGGTVKNSLWRGAGEQPAHRKRNLGLRYSREVSLITLIP